MPSLDLRPRTSRLSASSGGLLAGLLGTVVAVVLLLSSLFEPVQQLSQMYNTVQSATASLDKMFQILDTEPEVDESPDAVDLPRRLEVVRSAVKVRSPAKVVAERGVGGEDVQHGSDFNRRGAKSAKEDNKRG